MLMVIFGAGASYDSSATLLPSNSLGSSRPPLAKELFDTQRFGGYIDKFRQCRPLISYLQGSGPDVEQELEKWQNKASDRPERLSQLWAIRYYLQDMLSVCTYDWLKEIHGVTNYTTLLHEIDDERRGEKVCLVTFNYDYLLEEALSSLKIRLTSIRDYMAGNYLLVKLHGSINWARKVANFQVDTSKNQEQVVSDVIDLGPRLFFDSEPQMISEITDTSPRLKRLPEQPYFSIPLIDRRDNPPLFPVLSIPVEHERGFECPAEHVQVLEEILPTVTKVLVIGWKAGDDLFRDLLIKKMGQAERITIISSNQASATKIATKIQNVGVKSSQYLSSKAEGFSEAITQGETQAFLKS
jgi:hypothetical protein